MEKQAQADSFGYNEPNGLSVGPMVESRLVANCRPILTRPDESASHPAELSATPYTFEPVVIDPPQSLYSTDNIASPTRSFLATVDHDVAQVISRKTGRAGIGAQSGCNR